MKKETIKYIIDSVRNANTQRSIKNFDRRCEKFLEELGELAEARLGYTSKNNPKNKTFDDVKEEVVDVLIVALDIALTFKSNIVYWEHLTETYINPDINYEYILKDIVGEFGSLWLKKTGHFDFIKCALNLVDNIFKNIDEQEIIDMVDKKIAKWMNGRSTVITVDDEG